MRSTITLDAHMLQTLKKETGRRSKTDAVIFAIQDYLRRRRLSHLKKLKGKIHFDRSANELRHYER